MLILGSTEAPQFPDTGPTSTWVNEPLHGLGWAYLTKPSFPAPLCISAKRPRTGLWGLVVYQVLVLTTQQPQIAGFSQEKRAVGCVTAGVEQSVISDYKG